MNAEILVAEILFFFEQQMKRKTKLNKTTRTSKKSGQFLCDASELRSIQKLRNQQEKFLPDLFREINREPAPPSSDNFPSNN